MKSIIESIIALILFSVLTIGLLTLVTVTVFNASTDRLSNSYSDNTYTTPQVRSNYNGNRLSNVNSHIDTYNNRAIEDDTEPTSSYASVASW